MTRLPIVASLLALLLPLSAQSGDETPQEARHELMEDVRDAAKPVGGMLKGEVAFDAATAMESFNTWKAAAEVFGTMFPEGSETGYDTEARPEIWTDRAGFDAALAAFAEAVDNAIAANPQDLDALKPAAGPIFKTCKDCHEGYRVEDEG